METANELKLHRFLIGYRFATFWLAVILIQVVPGPEVLRQQEYFILSLVGVYTLLKVLSPMPIGKRSGCSSSKRSESKMESL